MYLNKRVWQIVITICMFSCKDYIENKEAHEAIVADKSQLDGDINITQLIHDCELQLEKSVPKLTDLTKHPRLIKTNETAWTEIPNDRLTWTSGFYPGILWYMYELDGNKKWAREAMKRTEVFEDFKTITEHHDIGFMMYPAYGNGYRIEKKPEYKEILITSANSLATRFNPLVGTIKSWSNQMHPRWKNHITIIDNMMNLELLFWAAKHGGDHRLYDIAVKHAETTMKNHFRKDGTSWHVLEYDSLTGRVLHRQTKQGLNDDSRWSRGQAWGIYGYTMVYRETKDKKFLDFAKKITNKYLSMLPDDYVPYWDFDINTSIDQDRDASAAAIAASALLELSTFVEGDEKLTYYQAAIKMLKSLSSPKYSGVGKTDSFLLHSTGAKSLGHEIDVALIYADYYYIEAIYRLKKLKNED